MKRFKIIQIPMTDSKNSNNEIIRSRKRTITYESYPCYESVEVDNFIFEDRLQFISFPRGRSSVKVKFKSLVLANEDTDIYYEMFISDFKGVMLDSTIEKGGIISGKFSFRKQGSNYGLYMIKEELGC